jgi:hypothetical protein
MVPGLGTTGKKFQLSLGWRIATADRSYRNNRLNHDFTKTWDPYERLSVLDVTGQYNINSRFNVLATMPIVFNKFSTLYPPLGREIGKHTAASVEGIGDITLMGQGWLLDSKRHPFHNVALGAGIKIPTGNWNAKAFLPDETGLNFRRRSAYPPAIMPGDGGVGVLVSAQAYRKLRNELPIIHGGTLYASASYLINGRDTNGTPSMVQSLGVPLNPFFFSRLTNSVTDSYNVAGGIAVRIPKARKNSGSHSFPHDHELGGLAQQRFHRPKRRLPPTRLHLLYWSRNCFPRQERFSLGRRPHCFRSSRQPERLATSRPALARRAPGAGELQPANGIDCTAERCGALRQSDLMLA